MDQLWGLMRELGENAEVSGYGDRFCAAVDAQLFVNVKGVTLFCSLANSVRSLPAYCGDIFC